MALAIVIGIFAGIIGFIPLALTLKIAKRRMGTSSKSIGGLALLGVFVSLIVLVAELFACSQVAHSELVGFGIAEILALIVSTSVYFAYRNLGGNRMKR